MRVGIVGGGQLARMLALAAYPLGLRCTVLDPAPDACAGQVAELLQGAYDDPACLSQLAQRVDRVTFDFENVPASTARALVRHIPVFPPPLALEIAQDRLAEKNLFRELGIATPPFSAVDTLAELQAAADTTGLPAILKTRRFGYDGKGQRLLKAAADITPAWDDLAGDIPLILEGFVPFEQEVSILALQDAQGHTAFYPLVRNIHRQGVLRWSHAPCQDSGLQEQARDYATRVLQRLDYIGLLAIEFFVVNGRLLANEMAPRVHNSGHWTIEGAATSQFENHLRAGFGFPLGSTDTIGCSAMVNCLGEMADRPTVLAVADAHYHDYGKPPRPGRKVGHFTLRASDPLTLNQRLASLLPEDLADTLLPPDD
ncbi:MAG: 5-(carboxyamino)imidazole ribonucleotide synthase [Gammaproteobacteria bacterium]|nr:5-(carboxyamino)imidazole ribonucleotide synthase [Gammaproteobacteria bacterium]